MMWWCKLFGHKPQTYFNYKGTSYPDGINRPHMDLYATCNRCDREYRIGKVHAWSMQDYNELKKSKREWS